MRDDPSVIALSLAVDYWDYLGWKDTLALSGHSSRQRAYAKARGDRQVYTPQAVIDGAVHALGSDKAAIERAIRQTREQSAPLRLPVTIERTGDKLTVTVRGVQGREGAGRSLAVPDHQVGPGGDRPRREQRTHLTYTNVVRRWIKLGDWTGKAETFNVPLKDVQTAGIDSAAVMVQSGGASAPEADARRSADRAAARKRERRRATRSIKKGPAVKPALRALGD